MVIVCIRRQGNGKQKVLDKNKTFIHIFMVIREYIDVRVKILIEGFRHILCMGFLGARRRNFGRKANAYPKTRPSSLL